MTASERTEAVPRWRNRHAMQGSGREGPDSRDRGLSEAKDRKALSPGYWDFGVDRIRLATGPMEIRATSLFETPFVTLREYRTQDGAGRPPLLLVPPLSGHFPALLRDMMVGLLPDFRVTVLDWANVRHVPLDHGSFGFTDNVLAVSQAIRRLGPEVSVVAVCQGGVPALAAIADLSAGSPEAAPAGLGLIAAPIDPIANPTPLVHLIRSFNASWYRTVPVSRVRGRAAGSGRMVYPAERQLRGLRRYLAAHSAAGSELSRKMETDDGADPARFPFADLYSSLMDVDARHFAQNIETVYLRRDLARGRLSLGKDAVDPRAIDRTAILTIEGECDDIAAPGQTSAAHALCANLPRRRGSSVVVPGCGHFGLFHGGTWRRRVLPVLRAHCLGTEAA